MHLFNPKPLIFCFFVLFFCCKESKKAKNTSDGYDQSNLEKASIFNVTEPELYLDNNIENPNLIDNAIFTPGSEFVYSYTFFEKKAEHKCWLKSKGLRILEVNLKPSDYIPESNEIEIDEVKLYVYRGKGDQSLAKTQSIIKFDYYSDDKRVQFGETTGVAETEKKLFLHPPRSHCFLTTSLHPFPYIKFPISVGSFWQSSFGVPSYVFENEYLKRKDFFKYLPDGLDTYYEVKSLKTLKTPLGSLECFEIKGESTYGDKLITDLTMYFNEIFGFVRLDYTNHLDSSRLQIKLDKVNK